jgi:glutamate racemase
LQQEWLPKHHPERRILGVLVPMVEAITGVSWMGDRAGPSSHPCDTKNNRVVAVFATNQTVLSNAYPIEIGKRAPDVTVVQQACPQLVDLIEAGAARDRTRTLVRHYVDALMARVDGRSPDVAILGCTHYPLIADLFAEALPPGLEILSQPDLVARSLTAYLARHPEIDGSPAATRFLTTGDPRLTSILGSHFFGRPVTFQAITRPGPEFGTTWPDQWRGCDFAPLTER